VQRVFDWTLSAGSACALVAGLAAFDERVHTAIVNAASGSAFRDIVIAGERVQQFIPSAMKSIGLQSLGNSPMVLFAVVSLAFFVLMFRA
jgi:hypothetical protein